MSPENQWLEDVFPSKIYTPFELGDMLVFGGVTLRPRKKWCLEVGRQEKFLLEVGNFSMLNFRRGSQIESGFRSKLHPG